MFQPHGLYGHIWSNNLKSFGLFLSFAATLVLLWIVVFEPTVWVMHFTGWLPKSWLAEWTKDGLLRMALMRVHYPLIAALLWSVGAFFLHARIIRAATGARSLQRRDAPKLYNAVETLAITAGIPIPRVEVMETDALNAYAAGLSPNDATIAVTRGLLNTLDDAELEGVLAHEITHIRNYDTRMMVIATVLSGAMCMAAEFVWRHICRQKVPLANLFAAGHSGTGGVGRSLLVIVGCMSVPSIFGGYGILALMVLALLKRAWHNWGSRKLDGVSSVTILPPIKYLIVPLFWPIWIASLIMGGILVIAYVIAAVARGAIARSREFIADAGAVELTKNPRALVSALVKLRNRDAISELDASVMALMISSSAASGWLATHPSHEARIEALQKFAGAPDTSIWRRRDGAAIMTVGQSAFDDMSSPVLPAAPTFGRRGGGGLATQQGSGGATIQRPGTAGFAPAPRCGRRSALPSEPRKITPAWIG